MRIGVDFDNTVVSYDAVFHRVALERKLIPESLAATKLAVRDHLRQVGREDAWTEMQGYVYGARMDDAAAFPGALEFFAWARSQGLELAIVSHKTRRPFAGHPYDLHQAARGWVSRFLSQGPRPLIAGEDVYFELTKEDKLARIGRLEIDWYVDDLPEILLAESFPSRTGRILFDPEGNHRALGDERVAACPSWGLIQRYIEERCAKSR